MYDICSVQGKWLVQIELSFMFHLILDVKILDVKQLIGGGGGKG